MRLAQHIGLLGKLTLHFQQLRQQLPGGFMFGSKLQRLRQQRTGLGQLTQLAEHNGQVGADLRLGGVQLGGLSHQLSGLLQLAVAAGHHAQQIPGHG